MGVRGFFGLLGASRLSIARVFPKDKLGQLQHDTICLDRTYPSTPVHRTEVVLEEWRSSACSKIII
ncbi:hypothetical protein [Microcoleus sp. S13_C5]|uniref:hypothetical protein n=1 Tax=Microcoleus sp. S13_C5 TaxID=3055411 RepID=UPI002FCF834A